MKKKHHEDREIVFAALDASMRVQRRLDRALSMVQGISLSEYSILSALDDEHQSTATRVDLASAVGLTPSGVTRALRPLEKLGYVETKKDERDARRSLATLTKHGTTLVRNASKVVDDTIKDFASLGALPVADRKVVVGFLQELAHD